MWAVPFASKWSTTRTTFGWRNRASVRASSRNRRRPHSKSSRTDDLAPHGGALPHGEPRRQVLLERHLPLQAHVQRQVGDPEAALAQNTVDPVATLQQVARWKPVPLIRLGHCRPPRPEKRRSLASETAQCQVLPSHASSPRTPSPTYPPGEQCLGTAALVLATEGLTSVNRPRNVCVCPTRTRVLKPCPSSAEPMARSSRNLRTSIDQAMTPKRTALGRCRPRPPPLTLGTATPCSTFEAERRQAAWRTQPSDGRAIERAATAKLAS